MDLNDFEAVLVVALGEQADDRDRQRATSVIGAAWVDAATRSEAS